MKVFSSAVLENDMQWNTMMVYNWIILRKFYDIAVRKGFQMNVQADLTCLINFAQQLKIQNFQNSVGNWLNSLKFRILKKTIFNTRKTFIACKCDDF